MKKPIHLNYARLPRSERLREADRHQCRAGQYLRQAADLCSQTTTSTLDPGFEKAVDLLIAQARVCLAMRKRIHSNVFSDFIDNIMKEKPKKKARKSPKEK